MCCLRCRQLNGIRCATLIPSNHAMRSFPMNSHRLFLATALIGTLPLIALRADQPPAPPEGVEEQAPGPVHESFAQPVNWQLEPGPAVAYQPPAPRAKLPHYAT